MTSDPKRRERVALLFMCLLIVATYVLMIDLKGISTDEGIRLYIINGGEGYTLHEPATSPTWSKVLTANVGCAYQPLYFLIQNTLMRIAGTHEAVFFRLTNVFFLWLGLQGLLLLSRNWALLPRLFLLGLFSFNAYLFMHVLQIREYIAAVAFYIWSTWLVLHLQQRPLRHWWSDLPCFAAYALLLIIGFYLQSWVVFPALAQGLFLLGRPRGDRLRYYAHLTFAYVLVLAATVPYLLHNPQKVNVGRWGTENSELWPQLSTGFHLVLAGHTPGETRFTDFLFWFWPAVILTGIALLLIPRVRRLPVIVAGDFTRQGRLMLLCFGLSLAFQIGYYLKVENLSLWPRYFIIHYFFLTWLIALAAKCFYDLATAPELNRWIRRGLAVVFWGLLLLLTASAVFQTRSYYRYPYLDTSLSRVSNWSTITHGVSALLQPGDVLVIHDYVARSTFTFTRAVPNQVLLLHEVFGRDLTGVSRLVYLESFYSLPEREALAAKMAALGYNSVQEYRLPTSDGQGLLSEWRAVAFLRK